MLRHAQIHNVVSQMPQKATVPFFTNANDAQQFFPKNGGKRFALAWALRAHPQFFGKNTLIEKNFCVPFAFVKNGTVVFETFYHNFHLCVSEHL